MNYLSGKNLYIYKAQCQYCELDRNKETDPVCKLLDKMLEGQQMEGIKCSEFKNKRSE